MFVLSLADAGATLAAVPAAVFAWARGYWGVRRRVHYSLLAAALLGTTLFLRHWNLLFPP